MNISTVCSMSYIILYFTIKYKNLRNNLDPNMARLQHIFKDQAPQLLAGWTWIQKVSESRNFFRYFECSINHFDSCIAARFKNFMECSMSQCPHCIARNFLQGPHLSVAPPMQQALPKEAEALLKQGIL